MIEPIDKAEVAERVRNETKRRDLRMKVALLLIGLGLVATMVWAGLHERAYTQWSDVQQAYQAILDNKATDERGRRLATDFEPAIRQVVLPGLDRVDRCVACHNGIDDPRMVDVEQPHRVHPGDILAHHPAGDYGCSICHRGQGRALVFEEVKAVGYHWPYPLLPPNLTQSSCGLCHSAQEIRDAGGEEYARGLDLFERSGCRACHKLVGRGGSLGPELSREGDKVPAELPMAHLEGPHTLPQWLLEHFRDPDAVVAGSQMKPVQMTAGDIEALTTYVLSLRQMELPSKYLSPGRFLVLHRLRNPPVEPPAVVYERMCATCHDTGRYGRWDKHWKRFVPAVRGSSFVQLAPAGLIKQTIQRGRGSTLMAPWAGGLRNTEIDALVAWLRESPVPPDQHLPADVIALVRADESLTGDASAGAPVFERHCAACHGSKGQGILAPRLASSVLQESATDGFLFATIAYGRQGTAMPAFLAPGRGGLARDTIEDLVARVRQLGQGTGGPVAARPTSKQPREDVNHE